MKLPIRIRIARYGVYIDWRDYPTLVIRWNGSRYWLDMNFEAAFPSLKAWRAHNEAYSQHCLEDSTDAIVRGAIRRAIRGGEYEEPLLQQLK
jgi:hypothetical protein